MPSIRLPVTTLDDLDDLDPEEIDELTGLTSREHGVDLSANIDARARSAELQARKYNERRKSFTRGSRRVSQRNER